MDDMLVTWMLMLTLFGQTEAKPAKPAKPDPSIEFFASKKVLSISIDI